MTKTPYPALSKLFSGVFNEWDSLVHIDVMVTHQICDDHLAQAKYEFTDLQSKLDVAREALAVFLAEHKACLKAGKLSQMIFATQKAEQALITINGDER